MPQMPPPSSPPPKPRQARPQERRQRQQPSQIAGSGKGGTGSSSCALFAAYLQPPRVRVCEEEEMTPLLLAIRHDDPRWLKSLLEDPSLDVNEETLVESASAAPQEQPTYPSTPLIEACRCGDERLLRLLLERRDLDVNRASTKLRSTALADACARGDAASVRILLSDERVDGNLGDSVVTHPALYACMHGSVEVLEALAAHGILTDALEESVMATASANSQVRRDERTRIGETARGHRRRARAEACARVRECQVPARALSAARVPASGLQLGALSSRAEDRRPLLFCRACAAASGGGCLIWAWGLRSPLRSSSRTRNC